jgi:hypothetical protein
MSWVRIFKQIIEGFCLLKLLSHVGNCIVKSILCCFQQGTPVVDALAETIAAVDLHEGSAKLGHQQAHQKQWMSSAYL